MKQSSRVTAGGMCLLLALSAALRAEEPAKQAEAVKPQGQRQLGFFDSLKASRMEKQLAELQEAGKFHDALKVAEAISELRAKVQGADHWQAVNARFQVEAIRRVLRATKAEQQNYTRTFALQREADALRAKGRSRKAQPLLEQVLAIYCKVLGEEHPSTATSYNNLAFMQNAQGKYKEAEEGFRKALAITRKVLGEQHPDTANSYSEVASNQDAQGNYKEAEEGYGKALAIRRKVLGEEHPDTATSYNNVACNQGAQGKYKEAEEGYYVGPKDD